MIELRGCGTALVTPFNSNGEIDLVSYHNLVNWQVESGIDFVVPCGTTGESATLEQEEYHQVIGACMKAVSGAVPVVAGAGTNNTAHAVELAKIAEAEGVDAILSVTPYYNKPTPEGLYHHFQKIADSVKVPVVLYNVPGRTSINMIPETVLRLSAVDNIIGVKEASGNLEQIRNLLSDRPAGFQILSGDDQLALEITSLGGEGVISVVSNLIPAEMSKMISLALKGQLQEASKIHDLYLPLMNLNFIESSPIPVKYALARMGRLQEVYRLPLCSMRDDNKQKMDEELRKLDLL